jgi:hypothetical protein
MSDSETNGELTIEDIFHLRGTINFECGVGGIVLFPKDIKFKAPPADSLNAGRLVLATAKTGSINVEIDLKNHFVSLHVEPRDNSNKDLLIRVPVGIALFRVRVKDGYFLYYETSDGYNILPHFIEKGTDPDQEMQELLLLVAPVPPRDPELATVSLTFKELTLRELNVRRSQIGLPPLPNPTARA